MIKAVVFDLDDTLYNERDFVYNGFLEVSKYISTKYFLDIREIYNEIIEIFLENGRGRIFNILCKRYPFNESIDNLVNIYRDTLPDIRLYDDALEILKRLKRNYFLGIITDGKNTVQWNKIKALNVEKYMDKIIVTDDLGKDYWKPSERPYLDILDQFKVKPSECIYIGDNPHKDFISAKKIGIITIRIVRVIGDHMGTVLSDEYEAEYKINTLEEVERIIDLINEKS
ncbi:MAG: HAD-IA family hydrolase [Tissierellaceae bacterium]